jgi:hypothetical protein
MILPDFPEFKPLTLADKHDYNKLVADFPAFSNISFASLHIWWNLEGKLAMSLLNGNLVIYYYISYDEKNSGYSLVGRQQLEQSIATIFEYLSEQGKPVRLVHIPEFVIAELGDKTRYTIEEELDYNEYVLESRAFAGLAGGKYSSLRGGINRFHRETAHNKVEVKELDVSTAQSKDEVFQAVQEWGRHSPAKNDPDHTEYLALKKALEHSDDLNLQHVGLYIDGVLYALMTYHHALDKDYYIVNHIKVDYSIPYIFDFMTHHIANKAARNNVKFLNMEMDLGVEGLRKHKTGWRPVHFFRQFAISPLS